LGAGSIGFSLEVLPMAHPSPGDLRREVDECLNLLDTAYRDTYCIDFDTLCIEANHFVLDLN
jgi:exosome complex RNA-binding protein Rrp42 (RNase PH superfamily)